MHIHFWEEMYTRPTLRGYSELVGYACECGAMLRRDTIADILNGKVEIEHVLVPARVTNG